MADEQALPPTEQDRKAADVWITCAVEPERPDYANRRAEVVQLFAEGFAAQRQLVSALTRIAEQGEEIARLKLDKNEYKGLFMVAEETVADLRAQVAQRDKKMAELHALIASYNGGAK